VCGRYATTRSAPDLAELFEAEDDTGGVLVPDYNVAPTDPVPVVMRRPGARLRVARWGLVPAWARDSRGAGRTLTGSRSAGVAAAARINARAETVATTNVFARAFRRRRCLIPADGWYEWRRTPDGRGKQAYFMTPRDGGVLAFAGVAATSASGVLTCAVVTTPALGDLALVHDRMPLLLPEQRWDDWLGYDLVTGMSPDGRPLDHAVLDESVLLAPTPIATVEGLELRPVGPAVGDVRNDGPALVRRMSAPPLRDTDVEPTDLTLF
jgi:putative SOS response-associated peptidase YedK